MARNNDVAAEDHFQQAQQNRLFVQGAKLWELRALTSLARLWQKQGRCGQAYNVFVTDMPLVYGGLGHLRSQKGQSAAEQARDNSMSILQSKYMDGFFRVLTLFALDTHPDLHRHRRLIAERADPGYGCGPADRCDRDLCDAALDPSIPRLAPVLAITSAAYIVFLAVQVARAPLLPQQDPAAAAPSTPCLFQSVKRAIDSVEQTTAPLPEGPDVRRSRLGGMRRGDCLRELTAHFHARRGGRVSSMTRAQHSGCRRERARPVLRPIAASPGGRPHPCAHF